jgi:hypothetical protein
MMPKTPGEKVRLYRTFVRGLQSASALSGALGLILFIHHGVSLRSHLHRRGGDFLNGCFRKFPLKICKRS